MGEDASEAAPPPARRRRRFKRRYVFIPLLAILALIGVLAAVVRFGALTAAGRGFIEAQLNTVSLGPLGRLHVEGLEGDVWRDFTIRRLTISDSKGAWLDGQGVHVTWRSWELFLRRLDVDQLTTARLTILRRPVLALKPGAAGSSVSVHLGKINARLVTARQFSYLPGLFDVSGALDEARSGMLSGQFTVLSLTHRGDRLDAAFDFGNKKSVELDLQAHEAQGGPIAGAFGLPSNQPFVISLRANGVTSQGNFQLVALSGTQIPVQAVGGWTPQGGSASGRVTLTASRLLSPYAKMVGPQAQFVISGARAPDGFQAMSLRLDSDNLQLTANGEADIGKLSVGPTGVAVTLASRQMQRILAWPTMGSAQFRGALTGKSDRWTLSGDLAVQNMSALDYQLTHVHGPAHLVSQNGQITLGFAMDGDGGAGKGILASMLGARPHGAAELTWLADGRLIMKSLQVLGPGLKATGVGQMTLFGALTFKGDAVYTNFAAVRPGAKGTMKASWSAAQSHADRPWEFSFDAGATGFQSGIPDLDRLLGAQPRLKGKASYDGHVIQVAEAQLQGSAGNAGGSGSMDNAGVMNVKLDWTAKGPLEIGPLVFSGTAKGTGGLTGTLDNPRVDLIADFDSFDLPYTPLTNAHATLTFVKGPEDTNGAFTLAGTSRYGPARGATSFKFISNGLELSGLDAVAGGAHVQGAVALLGGEPSSADLNIALAPGAFLSRGTASAHLVIADAPGGARATIKATAANADFGIAGLVIQNGSFSGSGPLARMPYQIQVSGLTNHGSWRASGSGLIFGSGEERGASFEGAGKVRNADFKTLSPAQVRFGPHGQSLSFLAQVGGGRAQAQMRQTGSALQATAELSNVSLGLLDQDFMGRFDAQLSLSGDGAALAGHLDAKLADAGVRGGKGAPTLDGQVKAQLAGGQVTLDAQLTGSGGLMSRTHLLLPAEATAAPFRIAIVRTRPMSGDFTAEGEVKPLWDLVMGDARSLSGQMKAQATLGGTLASPRIDGQASLTGGQFSDTDSGLKLRNVVLNATLAGSLLNVSQLSASDTGAGTLNGSGQLDISPAGASNFRLDLKGFRLIDNDLATAVASGNANIKRAADGKVHIAGALTIDRADVAANPPTPSEATPMDVVEINRQVGSGGGHLQVVTARSPEAELDVSLKALSRVYLKGRGLNAELSLDAHVGGTTSNPILSGEARVVRGDYDFAGKRFVFDNQGVVYLATAPSDIRLDLTATREDPALTAVIRIQGTAARPRVTLTSTPILPNDEVLSQVLFGSSASQLSPYEAAELASAISSMAGGGGFDILGNLRNFAHLDRLALGGATATGVTVSGGKYVTDNVYLELTGGRLGPSANVEWRVLRNLSVVSSIAGAGGDSQVSVRWRKDY